MASDQFIGERSSYEIVLGNQGMASDQFIGERSSYEIVLGNQGHSMITSGEIGPGMASDRRRRRIGNQGRLDLAGRRIVGVGG